MSAPRPPWDAPLDGPHSGPYDAARPAPRRPSPWWWGVGVLLLVGAVVAFALLLVRAVGDFVAVDATVPADGAVHRVTWSGGEPRMVWVRERDDTDCRLTDPATGAEVVPAPVTASFTRTVSGTTWVGTGTVPGGAGRVDVTCAAAYGPVQVGPAPTVGGFAGGLLLAIGLPLLMGLLGALVLVVTGVRWWRADRVSPPPGPAAPPPPGAPAR